MLALAFPAGLRYGCRHAELKNRILMVTDAGSEQEEHALRVLIEQVNEFNHIYKRKPKKMRRISCNYSRPDEEERFQALPQFRSFEDKIQRITSFSSLSHKNSISCPLEDEENAKF